MSEVDEAFEAYQARPDVEPLADKRAREAGAEARRVGVVVSEEAEPVRDAVNDDQKVEGADA